MVLAENRSLSSQPTQLFTHNLVIARLDHMILKFFYGTIFDSLFVILRIFVDVNWTLFLASAFVQIQMWKPQFLSTFL